MLAAILAASIALVQPAPHFGDNVTFALTYPQEAARQSRQPQYPDNPTTQVDCYQSGVHVMSENQKVDPKSKAKVTGGWDATTYPVTLSANGGNGLLWTSGGADCSAVLYSFDVNNQLHVWAQTTFTVTP